VKRCIALSFTACCNALFSPELSHCSLVLVHCAEELHHVFHLITLLLQETTPTFVSFIIHNQQPILGPTVATSDDCSNLYPGKFVLQS
jgi:hypothetical protein